MGILEDENLQFRCETEYSLLVNIDVERSFSVYKYLLNERRMSLSRESLTIYNVIYFNSFIIN